MSDQRQRPIVDALDEPTHSPDGVDLTLIRWMLSLTPEERLFALQNHIDAIRRLRGDCPTADPIWSIPTDDQRYTSLMPSTRKTRSAAKTAAKRASPARLKPMATAPKPPAKSMSLTDVMGALQKAGSEQTRKTYMRHGATGPMFGVSFGTLGALQKRIRVDHDLALKLWETGNVDGRNLAMKIADPAAMKPSDLDRWARENAMDM